MSAFMQILGGFAAAAARDISCPVVSMTEREVHHEPSGERPEGAGWHKIAADPSGYVTWERTRYVRAAS